MPYDIIILGGQSNAEGNGLGPTDRPYIPDERILIMRDGGKFGYEQQEDGSMKFIITEPFTFVTDIAKERVDGERICGMFALTFAKKYLEAGLLPEGRKLLIVDSSAGGTGFSSHQWGVGNFLHRRLTEMMDEAIGENDRVVAFLWHQGEHDAFENADFDFDRRHDFYFNHLSATVNDVRQRVGSNDLPFIAAEFVSEWRFKEENARACDAVLSATSDVCEKLGNGKLVMARDLKSNNQVIGNGDDIHFCRDALVTLGERYFDAYCEIKGSNK